MVKVNEKSGERQRKKLERTLSRIQYLSNLGYAVTEMWECDWNIDPHHRIATKLFRSNYEAPFTRNIRRGISPEALVEAVRSEEFFGLVECDIEVIENYCKNEIRSFAFD
jgi:hypothetical protein